MKILTVAAHPDDEILGCGGTIARLVKEGCKAHTLILGEGPFSRYKKADKERKEKDMGELQKEIHAANRAIGVRNVFLRNFPDNKFDTVALLDIVKAVEEIKNKFKPDAIYTHHKDDLNIDHRITYDAVLTACRPLAEETVKAIYSFEVPSSTEWNFPCSFTPNVFMEITASAVNKKIEALKCYKSEIRKFPHPRSEEAVRVTAKRWGAASGLHYAEAFELIRAIR